MSEGTFSDVQIYIFTHNKYDYVVINSFESVMWIPIDTNPQNTDISDQLRKHAYSNILNISPPKTESFKFFEIKILIFFHISA